MSFASIRANTLQEVLTTTLVAQGETETLILQMVRACGLEITILTTTVQILVMSAAQTDE